MKKIRQTPDDLFVFLVFSAFMSRVLKRVTLKWVYSHLRLCLTERLPCWLQCHRQWLRCWPRTPSAISCKNRQTHTVDVKQINTCSSKCERVLTCTGCDKHTLYIPVSIIRVCENIHKITRITMQTKPGPSYTKSLHKTTNEHNVEFLFYCKCVDNCQVLFLWNQPP